MHSWVQDNAETRIKEAEVAKPELVKLGVFVDEDAADEFNYRSVSSPRALLLGALSHTLCREFLFQPYWICDCGRFSMKSWLHGKAKALWKLEFELCESESGSPFGTRVLDLSLFFVLPLLIMAAVLTDGTATQPRSKSSSSAATS